MKLPKYARTGQSIGPRHSDTNAGPEKSNYDVARHETMRLKPLIKHGGGLVVQGFKEPKPVCPICDRLKVWCQCASN